MLASVRSTARARGRSSTTAGSTRGVARGRQGAALTSTEPPLASPSFARITGAFPATAIEPSRSTPTTAETCAHPIGAEKRRAGGLRHRITGCSLRGVRRPPRRPTSQPRISICSHLLFEEPIRSSVRATPKMVYSEKNCLSLELRVAPSQ